MEERSRVLDPASRGSVCVTSARPRRACPWIVALIAALALACNQQPARHKPHDPAPSERGEHSRPGHGERGDDRHGDDRRGDDRHEDDEHVLEDFRTMLTPKDRAQFQELGDEPSRPAPPEASRVTEQDVPDLQRALTATGGGADPAAGLSGVKLLHPLPGTLYPADMASPLFWWEAGEQDFGPWLVSIRLPKTGATHVAATNDPKWVPPRPMWEAIRQACAGGADTAQVTVSTFTPERPWRVIAKGETSFTVSEHPVEAPLVYRLVVVPIWGAKNPQIQWRSGYVSDYDPPRLIATGLTACLNCHHSSLNGRLAGWDHNSAVFSMSGYVTGKMGPTLVLKHERSFDWNDSFEDPAAAHKRRASFARISPDARYVVSGVMDKSISLLTQTLEHSFLLSQVAGVLAVRTVATGEVKLLPGANDDEYLHSLPTWTPDGKSIVFQRAPVNQALMEYSDGGQHQKFVTLEEFDETVVVKTDLHIIPFNEGAGGVAKPIRGASANGMNNYAAQVSPDGRWIVFCKSRTGTVLRPDSDLYIVPLEGGEARRLSANSDRMDSYHAWSPNAHWLAFASKRDGVYTNVYLTHIDKEGHDSPPVLLARMRIHGLAVNLPEFFNISRDELHELRLDGPLDVFTQH
jgi:hypothetical protein